MLIVIIVILVILLVVTMNSFLISLRYFGVNTNEEIAKHFSNVKQWILSNETITQQKQSKRNFRSQSSRPQGTKIQSRGFFRKGGIK